MLTYNYSVHLNVERGKRNILSEAKIVGLLKVAMTEAEKPLITMYHSMSMLYRVCEENRWMANGMVQRYGPSGLVTVTAIDAIT
jgi:uncharacterized membrane protein